MTDPPVTQGTGVTSDLPDLSAPSSNNQPTNPNRNHRGEPCNKPFGNGETNMTKPYDPHEFSVLANLRGQARERADRLTEAEVWQTRRDAERYMAEHGPDPMAAQHRLDLERAIRADAAESRRRRRQQ